MVALFLNVTNSIYCIQCSNALGCGIDCGFRSVIGRQIKITTTSPEHLACYHR